MAKGEQSHVALVVDDEPEHLEFLREFLESCSLEVRFAEHLREALDALREAEFRLIVVDMNIPDRGALAESLIASTPLAKRYPGIAVAIEARNRGYGAHSVVAYTVHDDESIDEALRKLSCRYVVKGRPAAMKQVIRSALTPPAR
jgi:CheY-like chemotaxis protein